MNTENNFDPAEIRTVDDALRILGENGIQMSRGEFLSAIREESGSELDESSLEGVSGGAILPAFLALLEKLKGRSHQSQGSSGMYHGISGGRHG